MDADPDTGEFQMIEAAIITVALTICSFILILFYEMWK